MCMYICMCQSRVNFLIFATLLFLCITLNAQESKNGGDLGARIAGGSSVCE